MEGSAVPEYEPDHRPPAAPPPAPPHREGSNELEPAPAFRVAAGRTQPRRLRPSAVGDLDPDGTVPGPDRHRDRLPGSTRAGMPDGITEDLADQQDRVVSARVPRTECLRDERAGGTRPLRPPGKRHALPDRCPSHQRTRLPGRPRPGKSRGPLGGHIGMDARLGGARQVSTRPRRGPSVRSVEYPAVTPTVLAARNPSAMRPWTQQHSALPRHKVTHAGTEQKRPASARFRS
jgi:hypothetical protein